MSVSSKKKHPDMNDKLLAGTLTDSTVGAIPVTQAAKDWDRVATELEECARVMREGFGTIAYFRRRLRKVFQEVRDTPAGPKVWRSVP